MPSETWARPAPGGFTLIEISVVLLILGISLAVAVPMIPTRGVDDAQVQALVRELGRAQRWAVERDRYVELRVGERGADYTLVERDGPAGAADTVASGLLWPDEDPTRAPPSGSFRWVLVFDPGGRPHGDSLTFSRFPGASARVRVDRWTGSVHVDWDGPAWVHAP